MFPLLLALGKRLPIIGDVLSSFENGGDKRPPPQSRYPSNRGGRNSQYGDYGERQYDPQF